jgi:hypothetical protein
MSNVTFQIGLLDAVLNAPYNGTLALDLSGTAPSGGTLTLGSFAPVTLSAAGAGINLFNLTGSSADVSVAGTYMAVTSFPNPNGPSPIGVAGYITLTVQGGGAQTLYIFGYGPAQASTGNNVSAEAPSAEGGSNAAADLGAGADTFNYNFTEVENNRSNQWFTLNNGTMNATGTVDRMGPVMKIYVVRGSIAFDDGSSFKFNSQGSASATYWYANGTAGITTYQLITIPQPASFTVGSVTNGAVGALVACGDFMVFWAGKPA